MAPTTLVELWEERVAKCPNSIAVIAGTRRATYAEVDRFASDLAVELRSRGVGPESLVGVCLGRSVDMVVALLGVLKAGGAYLPLDPGYPVDRLRRMRADADLRLVVCDSARRSRAQDVASDESGGTGGVELLVIDDLVTSGGPSPVAADARPQHPGDARPQHPGGVRPEHPGDARPEHPGDVRPEHLAYVIYTSGSTGRPKGVAVGHAAITSFLRSMAQRPGLTAEDRVLALTPLSFDISALELFLPLTVGATVVMAPQDANTDPELLAATIEESGVTVVQATPTTWRMLLASGWKGSGDLSLLCGGELLDPQLAGDLLASDATLWNLYGPTETTVWSTAALIERSDSRITVGQPAANTRVHVVDESCRQVAAGVIGELWIGGEGLARGYLNRPALTAERFVADPFGGGGDRLYRTGDLARWAADGSLEILGRNDQQVKVRGFRIELGEIEACLRGHPLIADALVVVDREAAGGDRLIAHVVAAGGHLAPDWPEQVRAHLAERLPAYMVPYGYILLDALPRTPAGKADRNALPSVGAELIRTAGRAVSPADGDVPVLPEAHVISEVWGQVLGVDDVSPHDDFFALGGQSLSAVRAVVRLREALGVPVDVRTVFLHPTPATLAGALAKAGPGQDDPIQPGADPVLSFGQERIWIFEQLHSGVPAYNLPVALSFPDGRVEQRVLEDCLSEIVRRHEALRTVLVTAEGRARPEVREAAPVAVGVIELAEDALERVLTERVRVPFALDQAPLLRADLLRTPDRDIVLLTIHHIASDGGSVDLLVRELGSLYADLSRGVEPSLAPLPVRYADFAQWQRDRLRGEELDRLVDYWREQLAGVPALELPTARPRPAVASHRGERELFRVPAELADRLRDLCRAEGVTLFMGLLAPLQVLLGRYADESDVAVGTLVGGRTRPETSDVVGYFVNTVVLRTDLSRDPSWVELLGRAREVALAGYAHQELPFETLVEQLSPERDLSRNPLFQVLFAMHEAAPSDYLTEVFDRRALEGGLGTARFDLAFDVTDHAPEQGDLTVSLEFATDLFDRPFVQRLAGHLLRVLEQMVERPGARLSELEMLAPHELSALTGGDNADPLPEPSTLVRMWDSQVRETPDAVCVVADAVSLSFVEVDRRASALARVLRSKGVGPEALVGVCLDRSAELVVALLGVLKAGGAYVPLDPGYPADRLRYLVSDSGVRLVVTDAAHSDSPLFGAGTGVEAVPVDSGQTPASDPSQAQAETSTEGTTGTVAEEPQPHHLAYVIYTSGSTGKPKGVAITHANITSFLEWNQRVCHLGGRDRALLNHSVAFDNSVWEIFQCLVSGAQLHLASATAAYDPEEFLRQLADRSITTLNATPSQIRILLESSEDVGAGLASVRLIFTGAEAVPHDVARRVLAAAADGCQVFNEYGPTEATVTSAACQITEELLDRHAHRPSVPFGRATDNARLYVLDPRLRPVAPGCRGLLYVGGPAVGRGYLGKPAKTAETYLPDPFAEEPGARMYATGDVVQLLPDGNLIFLGRNDHQVKLRGFRIELGEIESALRTHHTVSDCVVAVQRTSTGVEQLAAYLIPQEEPGGQAWPVEPAQLREHLADELPPYMLPQSYTVIDEIPLTPNGKVNRDALPAPLPVQAAATTDAPATAEQKLVAEAWRECLGIEGELGLDANFFEVGGNSLAVTAVAARLTEGVGRRVSPVLVFRHPTVAGLAEALGETT